MSRSTQFIGLNKNATDHTINCVRDTTFYNCTYGMFNEEIQLQRWRDADGHFWTEVEQCSPWSSGPMIFTCLADDNGKRHFEWVEDQSCTNEFDYELGIMWI